MENRDEPRSAQKPIRRLPPANTFGTPEPSTPRRGLLGALLANRPETDSEDDEEVAAIFKPKSVNAHARSATSSPAPNKAGKAPRMTKRALLQLELQRRREYAQSFFNEINETIFGNKLPPGTKLEWSKRLLTTAGRAHWKQYVTSYRRTRRL